MEIEMYRRKIGETTCDGILKIDNIRICYTAENAKYRPPAGTYHVVLRYNKAQGRKVPTLLLDSSEASPRPGLGAPYLAMGNGIYNCHDGRIILGTQIVPGCLKCSRESFMTLYDRINNSQRRGHEVTLKITE